MRLIADSPEISSVRIDDSNMAPDRGWTDADEALLQRTVDAAPLSDGLAYPTLYGSTPARHRRTLQAIAGRAREEPRGVCAVDESANVELIDHDSLTPSGGALILPSSSVAARAASRPAERAWPACGWTGLSPPRRQAVARRALMLIGGRAGGALSTAARHLDDRSRSICSTWSREKRLPPWMARRPCHARNPADGGGHPPPPQALRSVVLRSPRGVSTCSRASSARCWGGGVMARDAPGAPVGTREPSARAASQRPPSAGTP
jgi:hypothetical protein